MKKSKERAPTTDDQHKHHTAGIVTCVQKDSEAPELLSFSIVAAWRNDIGEIKEEMGKLEGFMLRPGYLPRDEEEDTRYFDNFDARSSHAEEGFHIICGNKAQIGKVLGMDYDDFCGVLFIERTEVGEGFRGQGLALRLMREAQHVFARFDNLVILKAHPDGKSVRDEDCLKLAKYYSSDRLLGFKAIKRELPGWLIAQWDEAALGDDEYFWNP